MSANKLPLLRTHPNHPLGDEGTRTPDLCLAKAPLSRLSYVPLLPVGLSRLERLTSRLSGECSNQLSYRPFLNIRLVTGNLHSIPLGTSPLDFVPLFHLRKEVIQPHLPVQLPCYDFVPVTSPTLGGCFPFGLAHRLQV